MIEKLPTLLMLSAFLSGKDIRNTERQYFYDLGKLCYLIAWKKRKLNKIIFKKDSMFVHWMNKEMNESVNEWRLTFIKYKGQAL